jgi:TonB family protein
MLQNDLPYLVFSLAAHAILLALLLLWRIPPEPEIRERRVMIEFSRPAAGPSSATRPAALPQRAIPGWRVPEGKALALPPVPAASPDARKAVSLPEAQRRLPLAPPRASEATGAPASPTPAQVLRGLGADTRSGALADSPAAAPAPEATGYAQTTALEWKEGERTLLLPPRLPFPELLLEKGLEVDVEAAFVVAPSGQVIGVQITRSSGFASVDREVEQALRNALFAESSREDSGRIQFRFRLERKE